MVILLVLAVIVAVVQTMRLREAQRTVRKLVRGGVKMMDLLRDRDDWQDIRARIKQEVADEERRGVEFSHYDQVTFR